MASVCKSGASVRGAVHAMCRQVQQMSVAGVRGFASSSSSSSGLPSPAVPQQEGMTPYSYIPPGRNHLFVPGYASCLTLPTRDARHTRARMPRATMRCP